MTARSTTFSYAGNILSGRMEFDAYREEISSEGTQSGRPEVTNTTLEGTYNLPLGDISCLSAGSTKREELKDSGVLFHHYLEWYGQEYDVFHGRIFSLHRGRMVLLDNFSPDRGRPLRS